MRLRFFPTFAVKESFYQLQLIVLAVVLFLNIRYNKNYFFNFIKKKLAEGYTVEVADQKQILQDAGIFVESSIGTSSSSSTQSQSSQENVTAQLEKLASLKEKGILSDEEFAAQKTKHFIMWLKKSN